MYLYNKTRQTNIAQKRPSSNQPCISALVGVSAIIVTTKNENILQNHLFFIIRIAHFRATKF